MNVLHVAGARPNFMKVAPVYIEMQQHPDRFQQVLVHTGQHYDTNMSAVFFDQLGLPQPDYNLDVGSGSHGAQTARIMLAFEPLVNELRPDLVVAVGDINSTLACALVCAKLGIPIAHVEAGLRSFDRTMPEEINRLLTDQIADLLFTPSRNADTNLQREGIPTDRIHFVGNVMIDSLVRMLPQIKKTTIRRKLGLGAKEYMLVTLHRPANVDDEDKLRQIFAAMEEAAATIPIIFPLHPRTRQRMAEFGLTVGHPNLHLLEPLGYLEFLALVFDARLVMTDSGGIQEETTYLGIPCLTLRPNTERPITIDSGTNRLVACKQSAILDAVAHGLSEDSSMGQIPELWDGRAAKRIAAVIAGWAPA